MAGQSRRKPFHALADTTFSLPVNLHFTKFRHESISATLKALKLLTNYASILKADNDSIERTVQVLKTWRLLRCLSRIPASCSRVVVNNNNIKIRNCAIRCCEVIAMLQFNLAFSSLTIKPKIFEESRSRIKSFTQTFFLWFDYSRARFCC